jgi:hypothetical protein
VVRFKKSDIGRPAVQAKVKQVNGKWLVVEAGISEQRGEDVGPAYRAIADIYKPPQP